MGIPEQEEDAPYGGETPVNQEEEGSCSSSPQQDQDVVREDSATNVLKRMEMEENIQMASANEEKRINGMEATLQIRQVEQKARQVGQGDAKNDEFLTSYDSGVPGAYACLIPPRRLDNFITDQTSRELSVFNNEVTTQSTAPSTVTGLAPPPPPRLARDVNVARHNSSQPGAVPERGPDYVPSTEMTMSSTALSLPRPSTQSNTAARSSQLMVANLVQSTEFGDLPQADELPEGQENEESRQKQRQEQKDKEYRQRLALIMLGGILLLVAVLVILVVILMPSENNTVSGVGSSGDSSSSDDGSAPTDRPSDPPSTPAPTSLEGYVLSLFPPDTVQAIQDDAPSPQAQAFEWLLTKDVEGLAYYTPSRLRQRYAMATLYYATGGANWLVNTNWLDPNVMECEWDQKPVLGLKDTFGVAYPGYLSTFFPDGTPTRCNNKGELQHLWLDQNNLVGSIPEELYLLSSLQTLSMGVNRLEGTLSTRLGLLSNLDAFFVNEMTKAGTIPSQVGLCTKLRGLGLGANDLGGVTPSEIWKLTNLDTLMLTNNPALQGSIPTQIGLMSDLRWLLTDANDFSGTLPTELGNLQKLEYLVVWGNRFSGTVPTELGRLSNLWLFSLFFNMLEGTIPTQLGNLSSTFLLTLRLNQLSGPIPTELGRLTNLIMSLDLQDNGALSGPIPTQLGLLTNLMEITLRNNQVSGAIPSQLGLLAPALEWLSLGNNRLEGSVPTELAPLHQSLYSLDLDGNQLLTGTIPEELCNLEGACIDTALAPCMAEPGLHFDCSPKRICGCDCVCDTLANVTTMVNSTA